MIGGKKHRKAESNQLFKINNKVNKSNKKLNNLIML